MNTEAHCIWLQPLPNFESSLHSRVRIRELRSLVMWCCGNMYFSTRAWIVTHSYRCKSEVTASNQLNAVELGLQVAETFWLSFFWGKEKGGEKGEQNESFLVDSLCLHIYSHRCSFLCVFTEEVYYLDIKWWPAISLEYPTASISRKAWVIKYKLDRS